MDSDQKVLDGSDEWIQTEWIGRWVRGLPAHPFEIWPPAGYTSRAPASVPAAVCDTPSPCGADRHWRCRQRRSWVFCPPDSYPSGS